MARTVLTGDQVRNSSITGADLDTTGSFTMGALGVKNTTASSATEGGNIRLSCDDGAVMAASHRLGVVEFAGAEDTSSTITVGARIEAIADATWSSSENGANLDFYTTDGDASQTKRMTILATGEIGIGETAPSSRLHVRDTDKALTLEKDASGYFNSFGFDGNVPYMTYYASTGMQIGYGEATGQAPTVDTMFLKNDGTVGIGTTAPDCTLNVAGALAASGPSKTFQTFASGDYTPSVANGNLFKTYDAAYQGATSFDDGVAGQIVTIISTNEFTYMVSGGNLKGGTTNITTAAEDVTTWVYDGTYWYLMNFMDQSADLSGGH